MKNVTLKRPRSPFGWIQVYRLYRQAFPSSERKPFWLIIQMTKKKKTDTWRILRDGRFAGFATTINGKDLVMLDYLAIDQQSRGGGTGTQALRLLQDAYTGQGFFVEIESPFEDVPDRQDRLRRRAFYRRCGLEPMGVMAVVFGVKMELLGRDCTLDFDGYQAFYRENYSDYAASHLEIACHPETL